MSCMFCLWICTNVWLEQTRSWSFNCIVQKQHETNTRQAPLFIYRLQIHITYAHCIYTLHNTLYLPTFALYTMIDAWFTHCTYAILVYLYIYIYPSFPKTILTIVFWWKTIRDSVEIAFVDSRSFTLRLCTCTCYRTTPIFFSFTSRKSDHDRSVMHTLDITFSVCLLSLVTSSGDGRNSPNLLTS